MLKLVLYGVAAFMEIGIGIWIFGKMFPKRKRLERRQLFSEWILYTYTVLCVWSFSRDYMGAEKVQPYTGWLLMIYFFLLFIFIIHIWPGNRNKKRNSLQVETAFFIATSIMIACQYWGSYVSAFVILSGNIFPVLFLYAFYECTLVQAYLWEFCFSVNLGLLKEVYIVYTGTFEKKSFEDFLYYPRAHTYAEIIYLFIIYVVLVFLVREFPVTSIIEKMLSRYKKALFLLMFGEWLAFLVLMNFGSGLVKEKELTATLIVVIGIMAVFLVLCVKFMIKTIDIEKNLLDIRNETMEKQYHELSEAYERYRCLVHDEKHIILYLKECLKNGEIEEAGRFLECQEHIVEQGKKSWTGIQNVDFMLNIKKRKMDELGIDFQLNIRIDEIPMEDADFVVVLGNLFDNAIDAVKKCKAGERKIYLSIKNVNEMFMLDMKNTSTAVPEVKKNRFITDKKDFNKHGWGVQSVRRIVEQYGGTLLFDYDESFFEVSLIINMTDGEADNEQQ